VESRLENLLLEADVLQLLFLEMSLMKMTRLLKDFNFSDALTSLDLPVHY
jgi:hypothetical protein